MCLMEERNTVSQDKVSGPNAVSLSLHDWFLRAMKNKCKHPCKSLSVLMVCIMCDFCQFMAERNTVSYRPFYWLVSTHRCVNGISKKIFSSSMFAFLERINCTSTSFSNRRIPCQLLFFFSFFLFIPVSLLWEGIQPSIKKSKSTGRCTPSQ